MLRSALFSEAKQRQSVKNLSYTQVLHISNRGNSAFNPVLSPVSMHAKDTQALVGLGQCSLRPRPGSQQSLEKLHLQADI